MGIVKSVLNTIFKYVTNRQVAKLEKAFTENEQFVKAIRDFDKSYTRMESMVENYCKKYPKACADAERDRRRAGI